MIKFDILPPTISLTLGTSLLPLAIPLTLRIAAFKDFLPYASPEHIYFYTAITCSPFSFVPFVL